MIDQSKSYFFVCETSCLSEIKKIPHPIRTLFLYLFAITNILLYLLNQYLNNLFNKLKINNLFITKYRALYI